MTCVPFVAVANYWVGISGGFSSIDAVGFEWLVATLRRTLKFSQDRI